MLRLGRLACLFLLCAGASALPAQADSPQAAARLFKQQRLAEAEASYQRLIQAAPESAELWFQLGLVRAARGRYGDAANAQRLAVGHAPKFGQAYCALALDLRESGQTAEAARAAQKAVALLPGYAGAWNLQANLRQDQGDFAGAAQDYAQALQLDPTYAGAWFNQAQLLEKQGHAEEALRSYTQAVQAKPDFAEAWLARAELRLLRHALSPAEADFNTVVGLDGWEPEGWWGLSRLAQARQEWRVQQQCLDQYRRAVRRRDRRVAKQRQAGIERPAAYEPGLPLSTSQALP